MAINRIPYTDDIDLSDFIFTIGLRTDPYIHNLYRHEDTDYQVRGFIKSKINFEEEEIENGNK